MVDNLGWERSAFAYFFAGMVRRSPGCDGAGGRERRGIQGRHEHIADRPAQKRDHDDHGGFHRRGCRRREQAVDSNTGNHSSYRRHRGAGPSLERLPDLVPSYFLVDADSLVDPWRTDEADRVGEILEDDHHCRDRITKLIIKKLQNYQQETVFVFCNSQFLIAKGSGSQFAGLR